MGSRNLFLSGYAVQNLKNNMGFSQFTRTFHCFMLKGVSLQIVFKLFSLLTLHNIRTCLDIEKCSV